jgi:hypothetical protein
MALVQQAVKILQEAASKCDPSSDIGQSILGSVQKLAKHAPPGQGSPGVEMQSLRNLMQQARQQAPVQAMQRQMTPPPVVSPAAAPTGE